MLSYIFKRVLLLFPTLLAMITINFFIIQLSPGGPVEHMVYRMTNGDLDGGNAIDNMAFNDTQDALASSSSGNNAAARLGIDQELVEEIQKIYGFDQPIWKRYLKMLKDYMLFDFGDSLFKGSRVIDLIIAKLPVSISLGLWTTLITYFIAIPLGIKKAMKNGSKYDSVTSFILVIMYAIPIFLLSVLLLELFSTAGVFPIFPLSGLVSDNFVELSKLGKVKDYITHMTLPFFAMILGGFASLTVLTKSLFLEEINKQYVITAKVKGLSDNRILYAHIFRNAMMFIVSGIPGKLITILFSSSLFVEIIFSLDGLGLLAYEAVIQRDYPVIFGCFFIYSFCALLIGIISDIIYNLVDPRVDFEKMK